MRPKINWKARIILAIVAFIVILVGAWIGRFDCWERGSSAFTLYLASVLAVSVALMCPIWDQY